MIEINGVKYSDDHKRVIGYTDAIKAVVRIETGVEAIEDEAFLDCNKIRKIFLPETLTILEYASFKDCENLMSIMGDGIREIKDEVFSGCKSLKSLNFENSNLEYIGGEAFTYSGLEYLILPEGVEFGHCALVCDTLKFVKMYSTSFDYETFTGSSPYVVFTDADGEPSSCQFWTKDGAVYEEIEDGKFEGDIALCHLPFGFEIPDDVTVIRSSVKTNSEVLYIPRNIKAINIAAFDGSDYTVLVIEIGQLTESEKERIAVLKKTLVEGCYVPQNRIKFFS